MEWYRRWTGRRGNRKLMQAGFWGRAVFDALCDLSAENDWGGEVPVDHLNPVWITEYLGLFDPRELARNPCNACNAASLHQVTTGLDALFAPNCGLLRRSDVTGPATISGWADRQPEVPKSSAERVRKHRQKLRDLAADVTKCNVTETDVTDVTTREEKRRDSAELAELPKLAEFNETLNPLVIQEVPVELALELVADLRADPDQEVFDHWVKVMGRDRAKFTDDRKRRVKQRRQEGRSVPDLKAAIDGCALTPWNMGENPEGRRFDDLELILRDAKHVEDFMRNAQAPPIRRRGNGPLTAAEKDWSRPVKTRINAEGEEELEF